MIHLMRQALKNVPAAPLGEASFLKYSTPNSGKSLADKVIFLVFAPGAATPSLCIKTVRSYGAREAIVRSFENLKTLNGATAGSPSEALFARALHLHDDGEHVFSVETACEGSRARLSLANFETAIEEYIRFQAHVALPPLRGAEELAIGVLRDCDLGPQDKGELLRFFDALPPTSFKLPHALQLGDLTEDNMLFSSSGMRIVDYDRVGAIDLPGFDLFGLCLRFARERSHELCEKHLREYFARIEAEGRGSLVRLLFLYYVAERTIRKSHRTGDDTASSIIADFSRLFAREA